MPGAHRLRWIPLFGGAVLALAPARGALAQNPGRDACFDAYEQAQRTRLESRLRASREQLLICVRDACPASLRADCLRWLDEVDKSLPTVVLVARGPNGDVANVRVLVDGEPLTDRLGGASIPMDPGTHVFRFVDATGKAVERNVVVREGERNQRVVATFEGNEGAPDRAIPASAYVLGGVGVLGATGFAVFGLRGLAGKSDLDACKGHCASDEVDAVRRDFVIADVSLGIGILALGAAAYVVFRDSGAATRDRSAWVSVSPSRGGSMAIVGARF